MSRVLVHIHSGPDMANKATLGCTVALAELIPGLAAAGAVFRVSGKSAQARGYDDSLLAGLPAEFAMPDALVALSLGSDAVLCY